MNSASNIWNIDETGISLDHNNPPKILARRGTSPHSVTTGRYVDTTVIVSDTALDYTMTPFVIYKGGRLSTEMKTGGLE